MKTPPIFLSSIFLSAFPVRLRLCRAAKLCASALKLRSPAGRERSRWRRCPAPGNFFGSHQLDKSPTCGIVRGSSVWSARLATVAGELALRAELTLKIKPITELTPVLSPIPTLFGRFPWPRPLGYALGLAWILLAMGTAQAATTLAWDANSVGAPSDGSGTWHGGNTWWNGTSDQAWLDGSIVIIGTNTAGTYTIDLDSAVSAATVT